jgi:hypothetical protein
MSTILDEDKRDGLNGKRERRRRKVEAKRTFKAEMALSSSESESSSIGSVEGPAMGWRTGEPLSS